MATVAQVLIEKADRTFHTIDAAASVYDALASMSQKGIGALVVTCGGEVVGMVTERDYARKVILQDQSSRSTAVRDIMSRAVRYARPAQTSDECMALMTEHRIRHLPVIDNGVLVGLVSIGDLVKTLIAEQQFAIDQLELYVRGGYQHVAPLPDTRGRPAPQVAAMSLV
jgi:CBS domain-containing protein